MSERNRLHPIAIVSNTIKTIKEMIVPIIAFLWFPSRNSGWNEYIQLMVFGGMSVFIIMKSILEWYKFTFRVECNELKIESGVFVRKNRYIQLERIHSIDVTEGLIQRIFGLVKVSIETAGGSQAEAVLTAIRKDQAEQLNRLFAAAKQMKNEVALEGQEKSIIKPHESVTYKQTFPELFLMSATSGAVGVVLSGMAALGSQFSEYIPYERLFGQYQSVFALNAILLVSLAIVAVILVYAAATVSMMFKYAYFTVEKKEKEMILSRGLLEKRQLTIPLKKIQGIRIVESIVRQPLGYATVYLEYAGGSIQDKESLEVMLFPLVKKKMIQEKLEELIPSYKSNVELNPLPARALPRYLFRTSMFVFPAIFLCIFFYHPWGYLSFLFWPLSLGIAYLQYKAAGWNITDSQLCLRSRFLARQTLLFQKEKIQSIESKTSWVQQRKGLVTITAVIKSGIALRKGKVRDVQVTDFEKVKNWFLPNANK